jgi:hypothetical protein
MAENSNTGFVIPSANENGNSPAPATSVPTPKSVQLGGDLENGFGFPVPPVDPGPQPRDYAIAGGVLLVLIVAFFFAKNAYANHLATRRVARGPADAAGWWLFIFLVSLSTASALALVSPVKFLTPLFMLPLGLIALVAIILMFVTGRRQ